MVNNISLMLDDMLAAVDEGLSYDGIVSIPQIGLEDAEYQSGLTGSLRHGVDRIWKTSASISQGAARALRQIQNPHIILSHPKPEGGIREQNASKISHTPGDQLSGGVTENEDEKLGMSSMADWVMDTRNHFGREYAAMQRRRAPKLGDDDTDVACGCFPSPPISRTRSEPIGAGQIRSSYPEEGNVLGDWYLVSFVDHSRRKLPGKNGEEGYNWMTRLKRGLQGKSGRHVELSEVNLEKLPENKEGEECVQELKESTIHSICPLAMEQERLPRKRNIVGERRWDWKDNVIVHGMQPLAMLDQERLPRKMKSDGEIRLGLRNFESGFGRQQ